MRKKICVVRGKVSYSRKILMLFLRDYNNIGKLIFSLEPWNYYHLSTLSADMKIAEMYNPLTDTNAQVISYLILHFKFFSLWPKYLIIRAYLTYNLFLYQFIASLCIVGYFYKHTSEILSNNRIKMLIFTTQGFTK